MTDIDCRLHESDLAKLIELNLSLSEIIVYRQFKVSSMSDKFQKIMKCTRKDLEEKLKLSKATVNRALARLSQLGLIAFNEVRKKVVRVVSPQEALQENSQEKVDEKYTAENHVAPQSLDGQCINELDTSIDIAPSESIDACDDSNNSEECNQSAVVESTVSLPNSIAKPVKTEKPRISERLVVPKLKQKLNCEYHPFDVLGSITGCNVYNDHKGNFCFQDTRIEKLNYLVNITQLINSLPDGCDSQTVKNCVESLNLLR